MIPIPAKMTKNNQPRIQNNAIIETRTETRIESVSDWPTTLLAASNSISVTKDELKDPMISGTRNQTNQAN